MPSILNATTTSGLVTSADNSGSLQLQTNNGTTAVTIDTSQNVGIGITTPQQTLHVNNSSSPRIKLTNATTGTGLSDGSEIAIFDADNSLRINNLESANILFGTGGSERMRLTTTGQLGLGVTPSGWGGGFKVLQIGRGSYSADGTSNLQVSMNAYYNGSDWKYISANRASNMYLDLGGSVNIRTTNTVGTVDGSISWTDGPYVAAGGTSWTSSSDENLKNITGEIDDALNKVTQLRAAKFTWKADTENTPQVGLIAQDLQNVLPECVVVPDEKNDSQGNPKFLGVNYDQVIPLLVAAIKELKAELDMVKAEVQALKGVA